MSRRCTRYGGSQDDVNWAWTRGYHIHTKEYSHERARKLTESIEEWHDDSKTLDRQVGWVTTPAPEYVRPLRRIAVRNRKKNGQWGIDVLLSTLPPEQVVLLARLPIDRLQGPVTVLLAYVYFYDLRGGGVETQPAQEGEVVLSPLLAQGERAGTLQRWQEHPQLLPDHEGQPLC